MPNILSNIDFSKSEGCDYVEIYIPYYKLKYWMFFYLKYSIKYQLSEINYENVTTFVLSLLRSICNLSKKIKEKFHNLLLFVF